MLSSAVAMLALPYCRILNTNGRSLNDRYQSRQFLLIHTAQNIKSGHRSTEFFFFAVLLTFPTTTLPKRWRTLSCASRPTTHGRKASLERGLLCTSSSGELFVHPLLCFRYDAGDQLVEEPPTPMYCSSRIAMAFILLSTRSKE